MLTVIPFNGWTRKSTITVPPYTSEQDRVRLDALSNLFGGIYQKADDTYSYTEARGKKCWLLWQAGFTYTKPKADKENNPCLSHPRSAKLMRLSEAVAMARMMAPEPVAVEACAEEYL